MTSTTDAQKRARNRYEKKTYKQFNLKLKLFQMEMIDEHCKKYGYDKKPFAILAIKEKMERDTGKNFDKFLQEDKKEKEDNL